ncbi:MULTISPECIES: glycerate kinase [unclassified Roseofilum]|uniref:glycerate kinase n=1 Tax=unclassified Roseofilum TaxID=2620099 RepID=UPI001B29FD4E|nr:MULTISPECIES: glycerate kinase [unclassified Roseofilum]MBP0011128.1 glycerate kinase [Roseofilum sp. Belize Diploria]MBP0034669.1 glycerate kinase [Roseofilum sp. Belize BBD 4]
MRDDELILHLWIEGNPPTQSEYQELESLALEDTDRAIAFDFTPERLKNQIPLQARLFQALAPSILQQIPRIPYQQLYHTLWNLWLPLAIQLTEAQQELNRPLIQGILGGQGTGKTSLAMVLSLILNELGYSSASLSLDDLYKTYGDRQLLKTQDPRFIRRGPPGTHNIHLGIEVLKQCRNSQYPVDFPRFDKSAYAGEGDRTEPEVITHGDIIFFEGWFVGVQPIDPDRLNFAPSPIESEEDRQFAQDINQGLHKYLPLWDCLDRLIVLYPTDYQLSQQWRLQAEQEMIATGKPGMSESEVKEFVNYFWRSLHPELFITPLTQNPELTDLVVEISPDHSPGRISSPMRWSYPQSGNDC